MSRIPLSQLRAKLYRYAGEHTFAPVATVAEADSIMFLCPKCFETNGGEIGTHSIRVDFVGRGVPDEACIHNKEGVAVRWNIVAGSGIDDLSLTPSILLLAGCEWHGFVTDGVAHE